jgi:hypothetical protein
MESLIYTMVGSVSRLMSRIRCLVRLSVITPTLGAHRGHTMIQLRLKCARPSRDHAGARRHGCTHGLAAIDHASNTSIVTHRAVRIDRAIDAVIFRSMALPFRDRGVAPGVGARLRPAPVLPGGPHPRDSRSRNLRKCFVEPDPLNAIRRT